MSESLDDDELARVVEAWRVAREGLDEQLRVLGEQWVAAWRQVAACVPDVVAVESSAPPMLAALAAKRAGRGAGPASGRLDGRGGRR